MSREPIVPSVCGARGACVFGRGTDGAIYGIVRNVGGRWGSFARLGGRVTMGPAVVRIMAAHKSHRSRPQEPPSWPVHTDAVLPPPVIALGPDVARMVDRVDIDEQPVL